LLIPNKRIISDLRELKCHFVDGINTDKRKDIYKRYLFYNDELKRRCNLDLLQQWIDGSFVTKKENPGDIDLVTFINYDILAKIGNKIDDFKYPISENKYGVDAYIIEVYPEGHQFRNKTLADMAYWMDKFTKTRRNREGRKLPKGFLELTY
jgi:hypothetical protein